MVTLGRILFVTYILIQLLAIVMVVSAIAALTGESYMIMSGIFALILWLLVIGMSIKAIWYAVGMMRDQSDKKDDGLFWAKAMFVCLSILTPLTGLAFAFGAFAACGPLWVSSVFHWAGLGSTIFAFLGFFFLPFIVSACGVSSEQIKKRHLLWLIWPGLVALTWGMAWLGSFLALKGDINESLARTGGYRLPFPGGESSWVIQGNNSGGNHTGDQQYAWDFRRRCGSPVLASRSGTIVTDPNKTRDNFTGNGSDKPNNFITIQHDGDNTFGRYLHIQQGSIVRRSGRVNQGDVIAKVGNVGKSLTGHIHFVVENSSGNSVPVKFDDLGNDDKGIPRTFNSYKSLNRAVP